MPTRAPRSGAIGPRLQLSSGLGSFTEGIFASAVADEDLRHFHDVRWATRVESLLDRFDEPLASGRGASRVVVRIGGALAFLRLEGGILRGFLAAERREALEPALEELRRLVPRSTQKPRDDRVEFTFWWSEQFSIAGQRIRRLEAPRWNDIGANYSAATAQALSELIGAGRAVTNLGRAFLWHGEPGTGKTYALRALAREWRGWCDVHLVLDPASLLGDADYLMEVASGSTAEVMPKREGRWRLIALEDTGELLSADARERVGQGLSRFLNLTDGLAGDGLRVLLLITTNEPVRRIHPAVSRPGRCAAEVSFERLSAAEADAWLERRSTVGIARDASLAELFAAAQGRRLDNGHRPIGFAAGGSR